MSVPNACATCNQTTMLVPNTCATCNHTPDPDEPTLPLCSACKSVRYCNGYCQVRDWQAHKLLCRTDTPDSNDSSRSSRPVTVVRTDLGDVVARVVYRKDDQRLQKARHPDAIFFLQILGPWKPYTLKNKGPYTIGGAHSMACRQLVQAHRRLGMLSIQAVPTTNADARYMTAVRELYIRLPDGTKFDVSFVPHINPAVAEMWRRVRTGRIRGPCPTVLMWVAEVAKQQDGTDSDASQLVGTRGVFGAYEDQGAAEAAVARIKARWAEQNVVGWTCGTKQGPAMRADGTFREPSSVGVSPIGRAESSRETEDNED